MKTRSIKVFDSHEAADEDDVSFYSSLTPQQRLDMVLQLSAACQKEEEQDNASREGCHRVYRVIELELR